MHPIRVLAPLALLAATACLPLRGREERDDDDDRAWRRTDARAWVSQSRLEIRFPAIALDNAGCGPPESAESRAYRWHATASFPDADEYGSHFMGVFLTFTMPDSGSGPVDVARLDSVLKSLTITVDEAAGEPPFQRRRIQPRRARAWWDGRAVRLRIDDEHAVREFLRARSDSVDLGWCQRDEPLSYTRIPLRTGR